MEITEKKERLLNAAALDPTIRAVLIKVMPEIFVSSTGELSIIQRSNDFAAVWVIGGIQTAFYERSGGTYNGHAIWLGGREDIKWEVVIDNNGQQILIARKVEEDAR